MRELKRASAGGDRKRSAWRGGAGAWRLPGALAAALLAACGEPRPPEMALGVPAADRPLRVAVSVPPQAYFVDRIGGERVRTTVLIPPGTDPHAWEPAPRQIAGLDDADLFVAIGHPAFAFEDRLLEAARRRRAGAVLLTMSAGIPLLGPGDGGIEGDPHVWLAPSTVTIAARNIADGLARVDPPGAAHYRRNLEALLAQVEVIDGRLQEALAGKRPRTLLVDHPAWGYLAQDYGLEQLAVEREGKEPTPRQLVELLQRARSRGVRTVFVQEGSSPRAAYAVAAELGARVVPLDPMAYDWVANMERVASALAEALPDG
jgi:zinc transport system substrate-binding protein